MALAAIGVAAFAVFQLVWSLHVQQAHRQARLALDRCDFKKASRDLDAYLSLRPDDADAHLQGKPRGAATITPPPNDTSSWRSSMAPTANQ